MLNKKHYPDYGINKVIEQTAIGVEQYAQRL